jgi:hypothetical protein
MNITEKVLFQQDIQNNNMDFSEFVLSFILCYLFTRMIYYFGGSYVSL